MGTKRAASYALFIVVGLITMFILVKDIVSDSAFPSFSDYIASTTSETLLRPGGRGAVLTSISIQTPRGIIDAMLATSSIDREKGLGGRDSLASGSGMLFAFASPGVYGFWMKDMRFPLDMVWIDADRVVSGVTGGISPGTYPSIFLPPSPIKYVLELNSGDATSHGIATGTKLVF